jgi:hypothetical protein
LYGVHILNPEVEATIDIKDIEGGDVIITNDAFKNSLVRKGSCNVKIDLSNLNFDIQSYYLLKVLVDNFQVFSSYENSTSIFTDITLDDKAWSRLDNALYNSNLLALRSRTESFNHYSDVLKDLCSILNFDEVVVKCRVGQALDQAGITNTYQYDASDVTKRLHSEIDKLYGYLRSADANFKKFENMRNTSMYMNAIKGDLASVLRDIAEQLRKHNDVVDIKESISCALRDVPLHKDVCVQYGRNFKSDANYLAIKVERINNKLGGMREVLSMRRKDRA